MRNLKVLILFLENNIEALKRTFNAFYSRYGIEAFDIAGVVGEEKLSSQGRELKNIPLENVAETSFDYLIAVGINPEFPNHEPLRKALAEKINIPSASIVYDKLKDIPYSHYLFIGDDLIINPRFDELNFIARTKMHGKKFLSLNFEPMNSPNKFKWHWTAGSSKAFYPKLAKIVELPPQVVFCLKRCNNFLRKEVKACILHK